MRRALLILAVLLTACSGGASNSSTTTAQPSTTTGVETTTTAPPVECPLPPYQLGYLPPGVGSDSLDPESVEPDIWTSVPGTSALLLGRDDGTVAIALIRGSLPARDWPGDKGEVLVDGTRAAVGPHPDGTWVAGWYEAPGARCDLYTMVFYPPVAPPEVEQTLAEMNRVGG